MFRAIVVVRDRVYVDFSSLPSELETSLTREFTYPDPREDRQGKLILTYRYESSAKRFAVGRQKISFPRGGCRRVLDLIRQHEGAELEVIDDRNEGDFTLACADAIPFHNVKLWPLQEKAVQAMIARQNCLLRAATGSGKSTILLAIISRLNVPSLVVVQTGGLMQQWVDRCEKELNLPKSDIGIIGDGEERLGPVTIGMNQTIFRRIREQSPNAKDWLRTFGLVAFDEVHGAAAPTVQESIDPFPAKYRFGVSASEQRKDRMEFLIYDLFGQAAADIKLGDSVKAGNVMDVEVRIVPTAFHADWYRAMVSKGGFAAKIAFNKLLAQMVQNEDRNALVLSWILKEVIEERSQAIVLTHRREHAMRIDALLAGQCIKTGTMLGGKLGKSTFEATSAGIRNRTVRVAIGTLQAIGQGIDLPSVEAGFVVTPLANNKQKWQQARGRICRVSEGKRRAVIYYFHDASIYGRKAVENLLDWNSNVVAFVGGKWIPAEQYSDSLRSRNH
jgi:superfamily II DNA or RNA helicase